jgi:hypothetical protein
MIFVLPLCVIGTFVDDAAMNAMYGFYVGLEEFAPLC